MCEHSIWNTSHIHSNNMNYVNPHLTEEGAAEFNNLFKAAQPANDRMEFCSQKSNFRAMALTFNAVQIKQSENLRLTLRYYSFSPGVLKKG